MTLENIINIYGRALEKNFIIKREMLDPETAMKAYKTYRITLYEYDGKPKQVLDIQRLDRFIDSTRQALIKKVETDFLLKVFAHYGNPGKRVPNDYN